MRYFVTGGIGLIVLALLLKAPASNVFAVTAPAADPSRLIEDAAEFVLLALAVHEPVTVSASGYTGSTTIEANVRATVLVGCDMSQAIIESVDHEQHRVTVQLPEPRIMRVAIDPHSTQLRSDHTWLWNFAFASDHETELILKALREAEERMRSRQLDHEWSMRARRHAAGVLQSMLAEQGWKIQIRWQR